MAIGCSPPSSRQRLHIRIVALLYVLYSFPSPLTSNHKQDQHCQHQGWNICCGQCEEVVGHLLLPLCLFDG
jgi:hypothetical protein